MADNNNEKNLKRQAEAYKKLSDAVKSLGNDNKNQVRALQELYVIVEAIKKGFIDLNNVTGKFSDLIKYIQTNKGLGIDKNFKDLQSILGLTSDQLKEFGAIYNDIRVKDKKWIKNQLDYQNSLVNGTDDLIKNIEKVKEVEEDVNDLYEDRMDSLSDLFKLQESTRKKIEENQRKFKLETFQSELINKSFAEVVNNMSKLSALASNIDPILDSTPVTKVDDKLKEIRETLEPISQHTFDIDGNMVGFDEAVEASKKKLDSALDDAALELGARDVAIPAAITTELQLEFKENPESKKNFALELKKRIQEQMGVGADPYSAEAVPARRKTANYMGNIDKMVSDSIEALSGVKLDSVIDPDTGEEKFIMKRVEATQEQKDATEALMHVLAVLGKNELSAFIIQEANERERLALKQDEINLTKKQLDVLKHYRGGLITLGDAGEELADSLRQGFGSLPGWLQQLAGTSRIATIISEQWKTAVSNTVKSIQTGVPFSKALSTNFGAMRTNIVKMIGPWGIILGIVAGMVAMYMALEGSVKHISTELGVSRAMAADIYKQSQAIVGSWSNQLATSEDVLSVMKKHQEMYGTILNLNEKANQESIKNAAALGKQYGIATEEIYGISQQFQTLGADSTVADNLTAWLSTASDLSGIPFSTITKDLAEASEMVAVHFKGMPKQAAKAAIEVRRMGMSLKQVGNAMDKALDISSFLTDMSELAAMTNGMVDMSTFFEMRFSGAKPDEMAGEIARQFDSLMDSGKANEFTMRKFAETVGMSVEELEKSRKIRKQLKGLSEDELAVLNKHLGALSDEDLANSQSAKMAAARLDTQEKFNVAWDKLKGELMSSLLPLMESFGELFSIIVPILGIITKGLGLIAKAIRIILIPVEYLFKFVGAIAESISSFSTAPLETLGSSILESIKNISWKDIGGAIGALLGGGMLLGLGKSLLKKLSFSGLGLGKIFGGLGKSLIPSMPSFKGITDSIKNVLGGAGNVIQGLTKTISSALSGAVDIIRNVISNIGNIIGSITNTLSSILDSVTTIISNVISNISSIFNSLAGAIKDVITNIINIINDLSGSIIDTVKNIVDGTMSMLESFASSLSNIMTSIGGAIGGFIEKVLTGIGDGLESFGVKSLIGAASLAIVAGALWLVTNALTALEGISWESLGKGATAIVGLGVAAAILGGMSSLIFMGALAFGAMGLALVPFAAAVAIASPGLVAMFDALSNVDVGQLLLIGPALVGIGIGLAALTGGNILSGIGSFLAGDPIEKLQKLAAIASPMDMLAKSLNGVADAMARIANTNIDSPSAKTKPSDKLSGSIDTINDNSTEMLKDSTSINKTQIITNDTSPELKAIPPAHEQIKENISEVTPLPTPITTPVSNTSPALSGGMQSNGMMKELIAAITELSNRPLKIYLGDTELKTVNRKMRALNNY